MRLMGIVVGGALMASMVAQDAQAVDLAPNGMLAAGQIADFEIANATPNTNILLFATGAGIGAGPCPAALQGSCMGILSPKRFGNAVTDANGAATISVTVPVQALLSDIYVQAVDTGALTLSGVNTETVGAASGLRVGSFDVSDGPLWSTNPPVQNCLEVCADLFGGVDADYSCSTSDTVIDNMAFLSGWGEPSLCTTPASEIFKQDDAQNPGYNCGSVGCSYSAYVEDQCGLGGMGPAINHCWLN